MSGVLNSSFISKKRYHHPYMQEVPEIGMKVNLSNNLSREVCVSACIFGLEIFSARRLKIMRLGDRSYKSRISLTP